MAIKFLNSVAVDTDVLFVDTANERVGIGTTSPGARLDVAGAGDAILIRRSNGFASIKASSDNGGNLILDSFSTAGGVFINHYVNRPVYIATGGGNVGIGTTTPANKLEVVSPTTDTATFRNSVGQQVVTFGSTTNTAYSDILLKTNSGTGEIFKAGTGYTSWGGASSLNVYNSNGAIAFHPNSVANAMFIATSGNVGIGTTSPDSKLDVTGGNITINTLGTTFADFKYGAVGSEVSRGSITTDGIDLKVNATADLLLLPTGNVGIGTTSPNSKLQIKVGTDQNIGFNSHSSVARISSYNDAFTASSPLKINGSDLRFDISSVEKMRINASGNVGIGTTNPSTKLHVAGIAQVTESGNSAFYGGNYLRVFNGQVYTMRNSSGNQRFAFDNTSGTLSTYNSSNVRTTYFNNSGSSYINGGNVGIGTTTPSEKLHIENSSGANIILNSNTGAVNNGIYMSEGASSTPTQNGAYFYYNSSANAVKLDTGTSSLSTKLTVLRDSGNVGIGTPNPGQKLSINGDVGVMTGILYANNIAAYSGAMSVGPIGSSELKLRTSGTERMRITSAGDAGIGVTTPRAKLDVAGGIKVADDTDTAGANKVGTLRYRTSGNNSYVDMCMQTGASTYAWINVVQNNW